MAVEIDGSVLEGGGQILRSAVAFSALLQKPVVVKRIRAKREKPGLQQQHLNGVIALQRITDAEVKGAHVGSTEITFRPRSRRGGEITIDIGTAGAITLVLQSLMVAAPFCEHQVLAHISGGTDVAWSPPIDYLRYVLLPRLAQMGYSGVIRLERRGYYPRGGGRVHADLSRVLQLRPLSLAPAQGLPRIACKSHCGSLERHVAERQATAAIETMKAAGYPSVRVEIEHDPNTLSPGSGLVLWTEGEANRLLGSDALGERGVRAETIGQRAAQFLVQELKTQAPVDRHQADMLIPYVAIAGGRSSFPVSEITLHTITNIYVIEQFLETRFTVKGKSGSPGSIEVQGVGLEGVPASAGLPAKS
jgi:RNA 3'-terminal phosphate cyclase (ATP)